MTLLRSRTTRLALFTAIVTTVRVRHVKGGCGVGGAMAQAPPLTRRTRHRTMARYEDEPLRLADPTIRASRPVLNLVGAGGGR